MILSVAPQRGRDGSSKHGIGQRGFVPSAAVIAHAHDHDRQGRRDAFPLLRMAVEPEVPFVQKGLLLLLGLRGVVRQPDRGLRDRNCFEPTLDLDVARAPRPAGRRDCRQPDGAPDDAAVPLSDCLGDPSFTDI
jgi:hypothetical protein